MLVCAVRLSNYNHFDAIALIIIACNLCFICVAVSALVLGGGAWQEEGGCGGCVRVCVCVCVVVLYVVCSGLTYYIYFIARALRDCVYPPPATGFGGRFNYKVISVKSTS